TYGFPLELTQEITQERGVAVDVDGFESEMKAQRERAKAARKGAQNDEEATAIFREVVERHGTTTFVGYDQDACDATVLEIVEVAGNDDLLDVVLDITPFYAESGGQVGDVGTITTDSGSLSVVDTTFALPGLRRHRCRVESGSVMPGQSARAAIDVAARNATRRNHTATHVLHWALRQVLGEHVKQAGSLVSPDRLRFDFSHYAPVSNEEIERIERLANAQVLDNVTTEAYETSKDEATAAGAIAFFGDKYGDTVRVLRAGASFELCGGTHVRATGDIGTIKVVSESSIGSNLRRIEAVTGTNTVDYLVATTRTLAGVADLVGAPVDGLAVAVQRKLDEIKALQDEVRSLKSAQARSRSGEIAARHVDGVVVERVDGMSPGDLRELALAVREDARVTTVVLGAVTDTGGVALVSATTNGSGVSAGDVIKDAARLVGGGGGGKGDIATAGGKKPEMLDEALTLVRERIRSVVGS
ncbi:MAG: alanine--tRNA ligase-related protein, partial [Actinomycetota bacterium]